MVKFDEHRQLEEEEEEEEEFEVVVEEEVGEWNVVGEI